MIFRRDELNKYCVHSVMRKPEPSSIISSQPFMCVSFFLEAEGTLISYVSKLKDAHVAFSCVMD